MPDGVVLPDDVPSYRGYPPGLIVKLLASRVAMSLGAIAARLRPDYGKRRR